MKRSDLGRFRAWFAQYTSTFALDDREAQRNIDLKIGHTSRVCDLAVRIAGGEALEENETFIAETAALFHDVGRFPQYAQYRTFRDSISANHGALGAEVLRRERLLEGLPGYEQETILNAVRFHNAFSLAALPDKRQLQVLKLVRDADKLDIWNIFVGCYEAGPDVASEVGLGLPDLPGYSDELLSGILRRRIPSTADLKTLNDFRLMLMSWVFDLNFRESLSLLKEQDYINRLAALLPRTEEISRVRAFLLEYSDRRLNG